MQLFIVCFQDHLDHLCFLVGQDILKNVAVYTDIYGVCHGLVEVCSRRKLLPYGFDENSVFAESLAFLHQFFIMPVINVQHGYDTFQGGRPGNRRRLEHVRQF